jgi:hypothetical protein
VARGLRCLAGTRARTGPVGRGGTRARVLTHTPPVSHPTFRAGLGLSPRPRRARAARRGHGRDGRLLFALPDRRRGRVRRAASGPCVPPGEARRARLRVRQVYARPPPPPPSPLSPLLNSAEALLVDFAAFPPHLLQLLRAAVLAKEESQPRCVPSRSCSHALCARAARRSPQSPTLTPLQVLLPARRAGGRPQWRVDALCRRDECFQAVDALAARSARGE